MKEGILMSIAIEEKYDYIREYFKKSNKLPYKSAPMTKFEKRAIEYALCTNISNETKSYADIPISTLKQCIDASSRSNNRIKVLYILKDMIGNKIRNFTQKEVNDFLSCLKFLYSTSSKRKLFALAKNEENSIISVLKKSKYYNENKETIKEEFKKKHNIELKNCYFDKSDVILFITTVFVSIPNNLKTELENRKKFLESKKAHDESDFKNMSEKMKKFYESGEFKKGDELLTYYTANGYYTINGVARNDLLLELGVNHPKDYVDVGSHIISEDLFLKTVLELSEIKKRVKESGKISKNLLERLVGKYVYRGLPLKDFLRTIQGQNLPSDWLEKKNFDSNLQNEVIAYLKGKISVDPAVLSASLDKQIAADFIKSDITGVLLKIDVTNYKHGLDLRKYSKYKEEKEIIFSPGTKLKIESVVYESGKNCFKIKCTPV